MEQKPKQTPAEPPKLLPSEVAARIGAAVLIGFCSSESTPPAIRVECEERLASEWLALSRSEGHDPVRAEAMRQRSRERYERLKLEASDANTRFVGSDDLADCFGEETEFVIGARRGGARHPDAVAAIAAE